MDDVCPKYWCIGDRAGALCTGENTSPTRHWTDNYIKNKLFLLIKTLSTRLLAQIAHNICRIIKMSRKRKCHVFKNSKINCHRQTLVCALKVRPSQCSPKWLPNRQVIGSRLDNWLFFVTGRTRDATTATWWSSIEKWNKRRKQSKDIRLSKADFLPDKQANKRSRW